MEEDICFFRIFCDHFLCQHFENYYFSWVMSVNAYRPSKSHNCPFAGSPGCICTTTFSGLPSRWSTSPLSPPSTGQTPRREQIETYVTSCDDWSGVITRFNWRFGIRVMSGEYENTFPWIRQNLLNWKLGVQNCLGVIESMSGLL